MRVPASPAPEAIAILASLVATAGVARAERGTEVTLGGALAIMQPRDPNPDPATGINKPDAFGGGTLALSFEQPPPDAPEDPEATASVYQLVPELAGGIFANGRRGEAFAGAGVRAELDLAKHAKPPYTFRIKLGIYGAARAFVIGQDRDPMGEIALGEHIWATDRVRIGFEFGFGVRRTHDKAGELETLVGAIVDLHMGISL